jgi:exopolyphosphatase/pppGpp-phosphohydrolase
MQEGERPIRAAIDIGSNTIHIVVARCQAHDLQILADELELVRLGESVNAGGAISPEKSREALEVIERYVKLAQRLGAETILLVATEAIRRATNRADFIEQVRQRVGLPVELVSGEAEATLTFYGATYELYRDGRAPHELGVIDLGGGSSELVSARDGHITWRISLPVGSGSLLDRYLPSDPPAYHEMEAARRFLTDYFRSLPLGRLPPTLVATGGSANSLWLLVQRAFGVQRAQRYLDSDDLARCEGLLLALSAQEIAQRYGQPYKRARILPAGALFLRTLLAHLGLDQLLVSPHGIREGLLLAYERYGEQWRSQVERQEDHQEDHQATGESEETFLAYGRRLLSERLEKMLAWRKAVLENEDVEAVHKMRVASRRLRALLEAYQDLCDPASFKKVYRRVRKTTAILGRARDADVLLQRLRSLQSEAQPDERLVLERLITALERYRADCQQRLEAYFAEFDAGALRRQSAACLEEGVC